MMLAVVVASGELGDGDEAILAAADLVVAADGGARTAADAGRAPSVVVGDLDSLDRAAHERLAGDGARIERHPADKEASDTELAVEHARELGAEQIVLLGAIGGERLDHELANVLLLADARFADVDLRLVRGATTIRPLHGASELRLAAEPGDLVTLLPVGGPARGVRARGLRWALDGDALEVGRSRGLSNEVIAADASVRLESGTLLVVITAQQGRNP